MFYFKFINCRETAPASADKNMFNDTIEDSLRQQPQSEFLVSKSQKVNRKFSGGRSIAVPGEMRCFNYAHEKYGKLPWENLIQPIIDLVRDGVYMSAQMEHWMVDSSGQAVRSGKKAIFRQISIKP